MQDSIAFEDLKELKKKNLKSEVQPIPEVPSLHESQLTGNFDQSRDNADELSKSKHYMMDSPNNAPNNMGGVNSGANHYYQQMDSQMPGSQRQSIMKAQASNRQSNRQSNRNSKKQVMPPEGQQNCCSACTIF